MKNIVALTDVCRIVAIAVAIPALRQLENNIADILIGRRFDLATAIGSLLYAVLPSLLLWFVAPRFVRRVIPGETEVKDWPVASYGYLVVGLAFLSFVASDIVGVLANTYFLLIGAYANYGTVFAARFTAILINVGIGIWLITAFRKAK